MTNRGFCGVFNSACFWLFPPAISLCVREEVLLK